MLRIRSRTFVPVSPAKQATQAEAPEMKVKPIIATANSTHRSPIVILLGGEIVELCI